MMCVELMQIGIDATRQFTDKLMTKVKFEKLYVGFVNEYHIHTQALLVKVVYKIQTTKFWIPGVITMVFSHSNGCGNGYLIPSKNT